MISNPPYKKFWKVGWNAGSLRHGVLVASFVIQSLAAARAEAPLAVQSAVKPEEIDELFAPWSHTDSPGCALAVIQGSQIIYKHGYGMADLSHDAVITPTTPFHAASVSKQFTAAAILLLEEQGKLSLDDDVRKYIPELPDFGFRISIRDLLRHTSGLRDQWDLLMLAGFRYTLDLITDEDVMSLLARQRELNFIPGSEYLYSNTGFTIAGQIVKRVSGKSLRQFTTEAIFRPLGMTDTHFRDDHAEINRGEALGYERGTNGVYRLSVTNFDTVGATSLYTTVEDLAKWDENFYAPKVGGVDFVRTMTRTDNLGSGKDNFYAMGLMVLQYRGLPIVEHGGADAGYRANILRFPEQHFSVISLCNTPTRPAELNRKIADLYLAPLFPMPSPPAFTLGGSAKLASNRLAEVEGVYRSRYSGLVLRLSVESGMLAIQDQHGKAPLRTDGEGHFLLPEAIDPLHFDPPEGSAQRLIVRGEGKPEEVWDRLPAFSPAAGAQNGLEGVYYSEELDTSYFIQDHEGRLSLTRKKYPTEDLVPVAPDLFTSSLAVLQFMRDSHRNVIGMLLSTERARSIKFLRAAGRAVVRRPLEKRWS